MRLNEAQAQLAALLDAALQGEKGELVPEDGAIVALVPGECAFAGPSRARRQFGSARGQIAMSDDFAAPLADFDSE